MSGQTAEQTERKAAGQTDRYGRRIDYLRISITDRCNLRCQYCMPNGVPLTAHDEILRYDEIERIARAAARFGIERLKVTGGEPLVRKGAVGLIARLKAIPGIRSVTITTNGILLEEQLPALKEAGLDGINISLDTLDREKYHRVTGFDALGTVLSALDASAASGIRTKVNVAVMKGVNTDEAAALAALARDKQVHVRFIEMMPIGNGTGFESVDNETLRAELLKTYPEMTPETERLGNGPAHYWRIPGFQGDVGFISAVNHKFCEECNRMRLTSTGILKYCLCFEDGVSLREILRGGYTDEETEQRLFAAFSDAMEKKPKEHCFDDKSRISEMKTMSQIGG